MCMENNSILVIGKRLILTLNLLKCHNSEVVICEMLFMVYIGFNRGDLHVTLILTSSTGLDIKCFMQLV